MGTKIESTESKQTVKGLQRIARRSLSYFYQSMMGNYQFTETEFISNIEAIVSFMNLNADFIIVKENEFFYLTNITD